MFFLLFHQTVEELVKTRKKQIRERRRVKKQTEPREEQKKQDKEKKIKTHTKDIKYEIIESGIYSITLQYDRPVHGCSRSDSFSNRV